MLSSSLTRQGCGHCKQLAPHFNKAAAQLKGLVPLGAVDCDVDENKQLCGMHGVKGFPTIKIFVADKTGDKKYGAGGLIMVSMSLC